MALIRPDRPHDVDHGYAELPDLLAIDSSRPAHVSGQCDCCHEAIELAFLSQGATHATIGGRVGTLQAGELHVIPSAVPHSTRAGAKGSRGLYVQLRPSVVARMADAMGVRAVRWPTGPHPISAAQRGVVLALRSELAARRAPLLVESLTTYLVGDVLGVEPSTTRAPRDRRLERAIELMRALPHAPHSLEELAAAAGLSKFRFAHLFKARYATSPHQYLTVLRLELAAERLRDTETSISQIAFDLGFSSSSRFARAFRMRFGLTPTELRVAHGRGDNIGTRRRDNIGVEPRGPSPQPSTR